MDRILKVALDADVTPRQAVQLFEPMLRRGWNLAFYRTADGRPAPEGPARPFCIAWGEPEHIALRYYS